MDHECQTLNFAVMKKKDVFSKVKIRRLEIHCDLRVVCKRMKFQIDDTKKCIENLS